MNQTDVSVVKNALEAFVASSINRLSVSGDQRYTYNLDVGDLNRQRLHASLIGDVVEFFRGRNVQADFDSRSNSFTVVVDLSHCILSPQQARAYTEAMETFRATHA